MSDYKTSDDEARRYAEGIIKTVHEPVIVLDNNLRVISASRSFYNTFKVKPENSVGQFIYDLEKKQWDLPELRQLLETIRSGKKPLDGCEIEHEFTHIGQRAMRLNALQIHTSPGNQPIIILAIEDITARKHPEEWLRESDDRYRLLVEASNDLVWTFDLASMRYTYCSKSVETILGYSQAEVNGAKLDDIFPPETKKKVVAAFDQVLKGERNSDQVLIQAEHRHKDSSLVWMEISAVMHRDNQGQPVSFTGVSRDITERKQAEAALRRSENYYRAIFETSGTAMFIIEEDTTISHVNSNFEELAGYFRHEVEGKKSWIEFIHPGDVGWMKEYHDLRRQNPEAAPRQYEFRFINRHSEKRNMLLAVDMIPGTNRSIASCIDITGQKQAEEALKEQSRALKERNKELRCLYGISRLVEDQGKSLDDILQGTANLLPYSWQYPEAACARIKFEDRIYVSGNFRETSWRQAQDIISEDELAGCVEIFYLEEKPPAHEGPFIKEERELIDAVAERLGHIIGRVRAQTRLQQSEQKFREIFHGSNDAVFIHDISGKFLEANQVACSRLGYSREELLHMTPLNLDADEYAGKAPQRFHEVNQQGSLVFESVHRCKDGSTIAVEVSSRKIDYEGKSAILSIARDITERKQAEQQLRENEEKYRRLVENLNEVIYTLDEKGRITYVSPSVEPVSGYNTSELLGKQFIEFVHPEDKEGRLEQFHKSLSDINEPSEYRFLTKDNQVVWVRTTSRPLMKQGEVTGIQGILVDITERKKAEQERDRLQAQLRQSQKMEAIGTLAGGIAHDFNNILASVLGYTELSIDEVEKGSLLHQNLSQVLTAGNRAKGLVKQILDFGRKEGHEFMLTPIVPLVKEALKMLRSTFPASIAIRENISIEQGVVHAEPTQLHQVMVNLATNAKQAMSYEGGILEVSLQSVNFDEDLREKAPEMQPGNYVRISVSDTGCGISEQNLDRIFEPYFTTSETGTGTGLGLSVVHGIVRAHKGHITVSSEPGKGTTFHVYLPLAEQEQSRDLSTKAESEKLPTGTESILLVDDEKPILNMQQQILGNIGYSVTTQKSSREALEHFCNNPDKFDLLIADVTMPDITGDKLAFQVKKIRPDVPVLLCTGFSEKIDDQKKEELGIEGYMFKPVSKTDLAKMVRKILDENGND
mgnify:CR=1 FL=1